MVGCKNKTCGMELVEARRCTQTRSTEGRGTRQTHFIERLSLAVLAGSVVHLQPVEVFFLFFSPAPLQPGDIVVIVVLLCSAVQLGFRDKEQAFRRQLTVVALKEANEVLHKKESRTTLIL